MRIHIEACRYVKGEYQHFVGRVMPNINTNTDIAMLMNHKTTFPYKIRNEVYLKYVRVVILDVDNNEPLLKKIYENHVQIVWVILLLIIADTVNQSVNQSYCRAPREGL